MAVLNIPFLLVPGAQLIVPEAQHRQRAAWGGLTEEEHPRKKKEISEHL